MGVQRSQINCRKLIHWFPKPTKTNKQFQLWKLDGNFIVSKFNNVILGINEDNVLSAYSGEEHMIGAVSFDTASTLKYKSPVEGI